MQFCLTVSLAGLCAQSTHKDGEYSGDDDCSDHDDNTVNRNQNISRVFIGGSSCDVYSFRIQQVEEAQTVMETRQIGGAMHRAFIDRVQNAKKKSGPRTTGARLYRICRNECFEQNSGEGYCR